MAKINNTDKYPLDTSISGEEIVIGSDKDEGGRTKNYKISDIADYIIQYFNSQNQTVRLIGDVTGGDGILVLTTEAQPELIMNKPTESQLNDDGYFLYTDGLHLTKLKWKTISDFIESHGGGGYTPPTYPPIDLDGDSLTFINTLHTNQFGHTISSSKSTIPDGNTIQKGVVRIATPSEYFSNLTNIALPPDATKNFLNLNNINGNLGRIAFFDSQHTISNSIVRQDNNTLRIETGPTDNNIDTVGYTKSKGFKTPTNDANKLLNTSGGEVASGQEVSVSDGLLDFNVLNVFTGTSNYQIPDVKNKFIYVNYDGEDSTNIIYLPLNPTIGQSITIMHLNKGSGIHIKTGNSDRFLESRTSLNYYWNGINWMIVGPNGCEVV